MFKRYSYRFLKSLLLLAGFCTYGYIQAHHVLGGEITYSNVTGKKYKFNLKLYRNCNDACEFGTGSCSEVKSLDIYVSPEDLGTAKKVGLVPLSLVGRKDITATCKGVKSSCSGGTFPFGIEEWTFEGMADFDTLRDYCRFEVSIRVENREDAWSQGTEAFYNYTRVNVCNNISNNSPVIQAGAFYLVPQNQSFTYNLLAKDPDGDSLSYKLVKAQKAFTTNITYPSSRNPKYPVDLNCTTLNCDLITPSWPIDGMDMDPVTGWMGFTATNSGQMGFVVMEVKEWRRVSGVMTVVGVTRRDLQITVIDAGDNAPKIATSSLSYYACAGQTFSMDFSVVDQQYNLKKDSVNLNFWFDVPGGAIKKVPGSINQFDAFFNYAFTNAQARQKPYYLTIVATDNHCPLQLSTYKTIEINVVPSPQVQFTVKHTLCNRIACNASKYEPSTSHSWYLYDTGKLVDSKQGLNADFEVPKPGKWYVVHQVKNDVTGCIVEGRDSVEVPPFSLIHITDNWPSKVCRNEPFAIEATFTGGDAPFVYTWNGVNGPSVKEFSFPHDSLVTLYMSDKNGCVAEFKKTIQIFSSYKVRITDTSFCMPSDPKELNLAARYLINPGPAVGSFSLQYTGTAGILRSDGTGYYFKPTEPGINLFDIRFKDSNQCSYKGSFKINVVQAVPTGISDPKPVCSNSLAFDLDNATGCELNGGSWNCPAKPQAISNTKFDPTIAGAGNFQIFYTKDIGGCIVLDTAALRVNAAPAVAIDRPATTTFCQNSPDVSLSASPAGGKWTNTVTPALNNVVSPTTIYAAGQTLDIIYYSYQDANTSCSAKDSIKVVINPAPSAAAQSNREVCEGDELVISIKPINAEKVDFTGDFSSISSSRQNDDFLLKAGNVSEKSTYAFAIKLRGMTGCADVSIPFEITIKPSPEVSIVASPAAGCAPLATILTTVNSNPKAMASAYSWDNGAGWQPGAGFLSQTLTETGYHVYKVKGILDGCESEPAEVTVNVFSPAIAAMNIDPGSHVVSQDFPSVTFTDATRSLVPYTLLWHFDQGQPSVSTQSKVNVGFPADTVGVYKASLEVTTDKGCVSRSEVYIRVRPGLQFYAPNAFTPNGKGPNETWRIVMDSTASFRLTLRNRWGEILFNADDPYKAWDGMYLGSEAPNGVYFWEMDATTIYGRYIRRNGVVTLYR